jgi:hypothetical protein
LATSGSAFWTSLQLLGDPAVAHGGSYSPSSSPRGSATDGVSGASAASIPLFIAVWLPLMRGTLTKPAEQPISAPPGKSSFGHRLPAALVDRARAIGDALAAFQIFADFRVLLPALEFLEREQVGVACNRAR